MKCQTCTHYDDYMWLVKNEVFDDSEFLCTACNHFSNKEDHYEPAVSKQVFCIAPFACDFKVKQNRFYKGE